MTDTSTTMSHKPLANLTNNDEARRRSWSGQVQVLTDSEGQAHERIGFRNLMVWKKAIEMALAIYPLTATFPDSERFGLSSQMRRAAISVPSNISEGYGRNTTGEFKQYLGIARGSNCELESQLIIAKSLGFGSPEAMRKAEALNADVRRLLYAYMKSL